MTDVKKVENLFEVSVKAEEELAKAIAEELELEDPDPEKAEAILKGATGGDSETS